MVSSLPAPPKYHKDSQRVTGPALIRSLTEEQAARGPTLFHLDDQEAKLSARVL